MALKSTQFSEMEAVPARGARLVTDSSEQSVGHLNYRVKSNWRRLTFDQEAVREGDVLFQPNQLLQTGSQAFPPISNGEPITLVHDAIFPNGLIVTIVGTPTEIFAFLAIDGFTVYEIGPFVIDIDNVANSFKIKGDWAAEFPAGKKFKVSRSIYNNGEYTVAAGGATYVGGVTDETEVPVDESIPFAVPDGLIVAPTYANIVSAVDTINDTFSIDGDFTGYFLDTNTFYVVGSTGNDGKYTVNTDAVFIGGKTVVTVLDEIPDGTVDGFMLPVYDIVPSWVSIASDLEPGHRWEVFNNDAYVFFNNGKELPFTWANGDPTVTPVYELREQGVGAVETITEYNGMMLCADILEIPETDLLDVLNGSDPYGVYDDEIAGNRIRYKILYSPIAEPRRWGVIALGSITAASNTLSLQFKPADWQAGTVIAIAGAGTGGGVLTTTITGFVGTTVTVSTPAVTTVVDEAVFQQNDLELGPLPGSSYELQDDNTGIVRMMPLKATLIVFKDKAILTGRYNGNFENPISFEAVYHGDDTVYWRWTLAKVRDRGLIYASKDNFYTFDLGSQEPRLVGPLAFARNLFFENVTEEIAEQVYASVNDLTDEVWFNFPDDALAYDFKYETCSLVGRYYSGSNTILRPRESTSLRSEERWFVGGRSDGVVLMYGLSTEPQGALGGGRVQVGWGGKYSNVFSMYQMGNNVYATGELFDSGDVGKTIIFDTGERAVIQNFLDEFQVEVDRFQEVPTIKGFIWENLYSALLESGWADLGAPGMEKEVEGFMIEPSSESGFPDTQVQILANNSPRGNEEIVVDEILDELEEVPWIPTLIVDTFFKNRIILTDQIERLIISSRAYDAKVRAGSNRMNRV